MKIAVCGTHGGGKSTLIDEWKRSLDKDRVNVYVVEEVARDCPYPLGTIKSQRWIWHEHYSREIEGAASGCKVILCDRTLMDNLVYMRYIVDNSSSTCGEEAFTFLHTATKVWMKTYDQIIRLPLNEEWITNADDELRPKDLTYAREIDKLFDDMLGDYVTHNENGEMI
jgi:GTPase SAR1 family protein